MTERRRLRSVQSQHIAVGIDFVYLIMSSADSPQGMGQGDDVREPVLCVGAFSRERFGGVPQTNV
jgi:hypothetical protein